MIEPLLTRLANRVILVGGKGGVGKTTTAGAIALALADRGAAVTLISTDPAHSISDLFGSLSQSCSDRLTLEEFDARNYADVFFRRVQPALVTLVESGTYLDAADANAFLDLSLPGIDEVMAALRLVDLMRSSEDRIVVDTAPTGHTLRLLQSAEILRSWVAAGRAMAAKGGAVASQLMRQPVRIPGEDALDEIDAYAAAFESEVLLRSAFVVVTGSGSVVRAETERLQATLRTHGVHVAATITNQATSSAPETFAVPHIQHPLGCAGLRDWARSMGEPLSPSPGAQAVGVRGNAAEGLSRVQARMVWVAGKGGVGKSTCAAALASVLAETRTVRIASTDPAGSLGEVFGLSINESVTQVAPRLYAHQIDAPARFERMRSDYRASVERVFESLGLDRAVALDRQVIEALFDFAPPGIDEIIALIDIMERRDDYDVTVFDSAPTGHFLRLLEMPDIALEWVHALMRLLVKYHALASLDALGHDLLAFSKRLRQLKLDLSTPETTAVYVVTLAQPMVIAETQRLHAALDKASIPVAAIIVNRANESDAPAVHDVAGGHALIFAPDSGAEIIGPTALRTFVSRWAKLG
jgi:arsenite-transporting ATPase